jgi:antitoxin ParD1/3/4
VSRTFVAEVDPGKEEGEKMDVSLPPELERFVNEQVDHGQFATEEEVVCEALRLLQRNEQLDRLKLEELRQLVSVGLEQAERGEVALLDMAAIRAEGRRRMMQQGDGDFDRASSAADGPSGTRPA